MSTSTIRLKALEMAQNRPKVKVDLPSDKISDYFGSQVFGEKAMKTHLGKEAFRAIRAARETGEKIDRHLADQIAAAMGGYQGSNALYTLVPAAYRHHGRKARRFF
jgi:glutamine synthetase